MRKIPSPDLTLSISLIVLSVSLLPTGCQKSSRNSSSEDQASTSPPLPTPAPVSHPRPVPAPNSKPHQQPPSKEVAATPTDEELLERSLSQLNKGNLAYNTPEKMRAGRTAHVTARIGSDKVSISTLESGMPGEPGTKTETAPTPVSTNMKMTLKGADFDVTPLSSEEQSVGGDTPTSWEWDVIPKHAGKLRLHLASTVELKDLSRDFTTIDREIAVEVDPVDALTGFIQKNWQWLIATLTAIVGALWKFFSSRKKPAGDAASAR